MIVSPFVSAAGGLIEQDDIKNLHKDWMLKHNKKYATPDEENHRFGIVMKNLEMIMEHNILHTMGKTSYTMKMNAHGDLTFDAWRGQLSFLGSKNPTSDPAHAGVHTAPLIRGIHSSVTEVDWRTKNAVTPVKDQGQCGSCWSFASTGAMEGAHAIATGKLLSFSEEQLINCVNGGQFTCDTGGDMVEAFKYVIGNGGIVLESQDPYTSTDGLTCKYKKYSGSGTDPYAASFSSYRTVASNDVDALKSAVIQQPVAIAIDASHQSFQFYSSGVYEDSACCTNCQQSDLDHGVLLVGFGTDPDSGKDYWLVKNSWNSGWGDNGYIKMIRDSEGSCGVPTYASYPIV